MKKKTVSAPAIKTDDFVAKVRKLVAKCRAIPWNDFLCLPPGAKNLLMNECIAIPVSVFVTLEAHKDALIRQFDSLAEKHETLRQQYEALVKEAERLRTENARLATNNSNLRVVSHAMVDIAAGHLQYGESGVKPEQNGRPLSAQEVMAFLNRPK